MEIDHLFAGSEPQVGTIYDALLTEAKKFGEVKIEPKKTSIHLVSKSAFLGIHPAKKWLDVTIVSAEAIDSPRIKKSERLSSQRFYNDVRLTSRDEVDDELIGWIRHSYELRK